MKQKVHYGQLETKVYNIYFVTGRVAMISIIIMNVIETSSPLVETLATDPEKKHVISAFIHPKLEFTPNSPN